MLIKSKFLREDQSMNDPIIKINNLTYYYPKSELPALVNVNIEIRQGEFVVIAGSSGGGKSTLCRVLTGLIPHVYGGEIHGEVIINGINVIKEGPKSIVGIAGAVFQIPENQLINLVVEEELAFGLENLGIESTIIWKRIDEVVKALEIKHLRKRATTTLSGGEAQKVVIASVIALKPKILLLDEPLAHLDPSSSLELIHLLHKLNKKEGITIIVFEHRLMDIIEYADRLVILNKSVLADGCPKEVISELLNNTSNNIDIPITAELSFKLGINNPTLTINEFISSFKSIIKNCNSKNSNYINNEMCYNKDVNRKCRKDKVIIIRNLWHVYPNNRVALKDINIEIERGRIVAIIGANGAGKTTLLKHLNGLLKPTRGKVIVNGFDTRDKTVAELSKYVGIVFQNPLHQFFTETVLEEAMVAAKIRGLQNVHKRAINMLKIFKLDHLIDKSPYELSVGEQRRLAIASILIYDPPIIALDEPTAGLDRGLKNELAKILKNLAKNGKTIIIATHDIDFLTRIHIDKTIVMNDGKIVLQGSTRDVLYNHEILLKSRITPPHIVELVKKLFSNIKVKPLNIDEALCLINMMRCKDV